ncbi:MAG: hypothetical protein RL355_231 [Actinomycetota bacterium]|jgi:molybdopterin synthase catalytic subunit
MTAGYIRVGAINNNESMAKVVKALVTLEVINPSDYQKLVAGNDSGAVVLFSGDVRDHHGGKQVKSLTYEAHPTAQSVLENVANEICQKHDVNQVALAHRHGEIPIGQCAFVVAVAASHREAAFTACSELVDEVKRQIPIWKHQVFIDGTEEWVNFA